MGENSDEGQFFARGGAGGEEAQFVTDAAGCRRAAGGREMHCGASHSEASVSELPEADLPGEALSLKTSRADGFLLADLNAHFGGSTAERGKRAAIVRLLERRFRARLIEHATFALEKSEPHFSARTVLTKQQRKVFLAVVLACIFLVALTPQVGALIIASAIAASYLANAVFRGWLFWVGSDQVNQQGACARKNEILMEFPRYTILVPLYREANVVPQLIKSLRSIDYPGIR